MAPQTEGSGAAWITNVQVDDPDATAEQVRAAGGTVLAGPFDTTGGRFAAIADPARRRVRRLAAGGRDRRGAWSTSRARGR